MSPKESIDLESTMEQLAVTPGSKVACVLSSHTGFFANWHCVLGLLEGCSQYGYTPTTQFTTGFYTDESRNENWWHNYFEPFPGEEPIVVQRTEARVHASTRLGQYAFANMTDKRGEWLTHKYLRVRPDIPAEVDKFAGHWFTGRHVIGLHRRGGNIVLHENTPVVPPEYAAEYIERYIQSLSKPWRLFVAACEQPFVDSLKRYFGEDCVYQEGAIRASGIHTAYYSSAYDALGYRKGREVLVDALLLARADYFFWTYSAVSKAVLKMPPALKGVDLTECHRGSHNDRERVRELQAIHKPLRKRAENMHDGYEFHLQAWGGMCCRWRAVVGASAYCEVTGKKLIVHWGPFDRIKSGNVPFPITMSELWDHPYEEVNEEEARFPKDRMALSTRGNVYLRENHLLPFAPYMGRPIGSYLRRFQPTAEVRGMVHLALVGLGGPTVGVILRSYRNEPKESPEWFVERMTQIVELCPDVRFYLTTDCVEVDELIYRTFPGRITALKHGTDYEYDKEGIKRTLADLYIVAACDWVVGTRRSTYSQMAALMRGAARVGEGAARSAKGGRYETADNQAAEGDMLRSLGLT